MTHLQRQSRVPWCHLRFWPQRRRGLCVLQKILLDSWFTYIFLISLVLRASIIEVVTWKKSLPSPVYPHSFFPALGTVTFPPLGLHLVCPFGCLKGAPATATTPIERISRLSSFHAIKLAVIHSLHLKAAGCKRCRRCDSDPPEPRKDCLCVW